MHEEQASLEQKNQELVVSFHHSIPYMAPILTVTGCVQRQEQSARAVTEALPVSQSPSYGYPRR